jgi:hypothetical protein
MIPRKTALIGSILLVGCAEAPVMSLVRTDGERISGNPKFEQALQIDKTVCLGERQKANLSGVSFSGGGLSGILAQQQRRDAADAVMTGCMAQKGYVLVPAAEAEAKASAFRATALNGGNTVTGSVAAPPQQ